MYRAEKHLLNHLPCTKAKLCLEPAEALKKKKIDWLSFRAFKPLLFFIRLFKHGSTKLLSIINKLLVLAVKKINPTSSSRLQEGCVQHGKSSLIQVLMSNLSFTSLSEPIFHFLLHSPKVLGGPLQKAQKHFI